MARGSLLAIRSICATPDGTTWWWMLDLDLRQTQAGVALSECPVGDLLCVRAFAEALLDGQDCSGPFRRDARLILTAAGLHLQASVAAGPSLSGLRIF